MLNVCGLNSTYYIAVVKVKCSLAGCREAEQSNHSEAISRAQVMSDSRPLTIE